MAMRIGIDLGGTKIEGIVLAPDGAEMVRERITTPQDDYQGTLAAIVDLISRLEKSVDKQCSIGIGMPGSQSRATGLVKNSNSICLNGRPLHRDLESMLGRSLRFANDADCFALSEASDGAAAGATGTRPRHQRGRRRLERTRERRSSRRWRATPRCDP